MTGPSTVLDVLAEVMVDLMAADPRRVLIGEDVADGGMLGLSRRCAEEPSLQARLLATPLVPAATFAYAAGLAMSGRRPIVVLPSSVPLLEGLAGLREAGLMAWRTAGARPVPVLILAPTGPGFGLGGDAADGPEAIVSRITGVRVVMVGRASEAPAIVRAAAEFESGHDPTVVLLPRTLLLQAPGEPAPLQRPLGQPNTLRTGPAATVFAWGPTVDRCLDAVAQTGVDATVVDVGGLAPLHHQSLVAAAQQSGKVVIAHGGPRAHGIGAEIAALLADEAILSLDAPIVRVAGHDGPVRPEREALAVPTVDAIAAAIVRVATY